MAENKTAEEINELSEKFKHLFRIRKSLEECTNPIKNHPDPNSIDDCWNWIDELLIDIKSEYDKTKKMLTDFQKAYGFSPYCHPNSKQFANMARELTQQQSANAELKKQNAELESKLETETIRLNFMNESYENLRIQHEQVLQEIAKFKNTPPKN